MKKIIYMFVFLISVFICNSLNVNAVNLTSYFAWDNYIEDYYESSYRTYGWIIKPEILCTYTIEVEKTTYYTAIVYVSSDSIFHDKDYFSFLLHDSNGVVTHSDIISHNTPYTIITGFSCPVLLTHEIVAGYLDGVFQYNTFSLKDYVNLSDALSADKNYDYKDDIEIDETAYRKEEFETINKANSSEILCYYDYYTSNLDLRIGIFEDAVSGKNYVAAYEINSITKTPNFITYSEDSTSYSEYVKHFGTNNGSCPVYSYFDGINSICFDNDGINCKYYNESKYYSGVTNSYENEGYVDFYLNLEEFKLCETSALKVFRIIGYLIVIIKILIPLIIIVQATIAFMSVILRADDNDMKSNFVIIMKKIVAGILIFFIPTIIYLILELINNMNSINNKFAECNVCLFEPSGSECTKNIEAIE